MQKVAAAELLRAVGILVEFFFYYRFYIVFVGLLSTLILN
jgi:hypothetical protein